jgi:hypothetical protein
VRAFVHGTESTNVARRAHHLVVRAHHVDTARTLPHPTVHPMADDRHPEPRPGPVLLGAATEPAATADLAVGGTSMA